MKFSRDWTKIRGTRIATVFQDPMTSLNPIITIGKQITSVILKHQECSEAEARRKAGLDFRMRALSRQMKQKITVFSGEI